MARTGRPRTKTTVECSNCGTQIERHPSAIERSKTKMFFCSSQCRNAKGSKPKTGRYRPCEHCGQDFWVIPAEEDRAKFCSATCRDTSHRVGTEIRTCEGCGADFVFNLTMEKWNAGRFCSKTCMHSYRKAQSIGRTKKTGDGYIVVRQPDHPAAHKSGWVFQHRLVMEGMIGRQMLPNENVHHINGIRDDNRPENLELWVKGQPSGQRVDDIVAWCVTNLKLYAPHLLAEGNTDE